MSIKIQKINREVVRPIPNIGGSPIDNRPIKGAHIIPELYANIFLVAKKNSGKTTVIWHILSNCVTKDTTVIIFASTVHKDRGWLNIQKLLKKVNIPCLAYNTMKDEGVDRLEVLVKKLKQDAKDREEGTNEDDEKSDDYDYEVAMFKNESDSEDEEPRKRKSKYRSPEYIIVMDDLSSELKNPNLVELIQENRHFFCKTIISSQYVKNLLPASRENIDLWIMFKGITEDKLEVIHKDANTELTLEQFYKYYNLATMDSKTNKHNFFYFLPRLNDYRRNFNLKIGT